MSANVMLPSEDATIYWHLSKSLHSARRDNDCVEIADVLDELDVLALHTDSARIRRMCRSQIAAVQMEQAAPGSAA